MSRAVRLLSVLSLIAAGLIALPAVTSQPQVAADDAVVDGDCDEAEFDAALTTAHQGSGGTITFDADDCPDGTTITFTSPKEIDNDITIDGDDRVTLSGGDSTLDPEDRAQLFQVTSSGDFTLQNITLTNGGAFEETGDVLSQHGGTVHNNGGTLTVDDSHFSNNEAEIRGGAIYSDGGTTTIYDSEFTDNRAGSGGAFDNNGGAFDIERSTFSDNESNNSSGAISNFNGTATITDSTLEDNQAGSSGGAISNYAQSSEIASLVIESSTIAVNSAASGGAVDVGGDGSTVDVLNSTLDGNSIDDSSSGSGSGIFMTSGSLSVKSSTLATGEFEPLIQTQQGATATFEASILSVTDGEACGGLGTYNSNGYNLVENNTCDFDATGDRIDGEANLADLADNDGETETRIPVAPSDAINMIPVTNGACDAGENEDQRNVARPQLDACDIGAVEVQVDEIDEQVLCANRYNGDLRMPRAEECASTEVLFELPDDGPIDICVNRYNGDARYSRTGTCASTETYIEVQGIHAQPVCVNRYNGDVRVPRVEGQCASTEIARRI